jgi:mannitol-specific phosphotransferase system IIBC component
MDFPVYQLTYTRAKIVFLNRPGDSGIFLFIHFIKTHNQGDFLYYIFSEL